MNKKNGAHHGNHADGLSSAVTKDIFLPKLTQMCVSTHSEVTYATPARRLYDILFN